MKLSNVLDLDTRVEGSKEEIQKWLRKIPVIEKKAKENERVSLELIEELIIKLCKKYKMRMQWIDLTMLEDERPWYSVSLKSEVDNSWLGSMYGATIYELYCKTVLFLYAHTRGM